MLQTTEKPGAIDRSYQLLALLDVCVECARGFEDMAPNRIPARASNLANTLELAGEIAADLHDAMERAERDHGKGVAS